MLPEILSVDRQLCAFHKGSKAGAVNHFRTGRLVRFNPNHTYPQACTDYDKWQIAEVRGLLRQACTTQHSLTLTSNLPSHLDLQDAAARRQRCHSRLDSDN